MSKSLQTIYLKDYTAYPYELQYVNLSIALNPEVTIVTNEMGFILNERYQGTNHDIVLNGEDLILKEVWVNNELLDAGDYTLTDKTLTIPCTHTQNHCLKIVSTNAPRENTRLCGMRIQGN